MLDRLMIYLWIINEVNVISSVLIVAWRLLLPIHHSSELSIIQQIVASVRSIQNLPNYCIAESKS